ncbi:hypothetical protein TRFO_01019 [Tritrichomonas foetus]|uniref:Uncharacterized protein n=1 Tax=Tritrichomonas foetus TaxID=1144522 RepID=A0A1J4L2G5_9EUKA|nr:hypothetical protein TRFO_01019 [Tritrichomonas foetus]|eukprot:OHT17703.1 hypothetical protein TRFO_01019 [Tritrichomonas foetus]
MKDHFLFRKMNYLLSTADRYISMVVGAISDIMTEYKHRKWANKEKSLMVWEVSVILVSFFIATIIVAILPEPEHKVRIGNNLVDLEMLLKFFPQSLKFLLNIFDRLRFLKDAFLKLKFYLDFYLGPLMNIILYIPNKFFGLLHFFLISLAALLTNICVFFADFFNRIGFYLSIPFKFIFDFFNMIGQFIFKLFDIFIHLPGISHLINFISLILHDLIILLTSFFVSFARIGEFFGRLFGNFSFGKIWLYLKEFKFIKFLISIPTWIFDYLSHVLGNVLRFFHLYGFFGNLYGLLLRFCLFVVNILANIFLHLHNILLYIPRFCNWLIIHLKKIEIRFIPVEFLRNFFTFILNVLKWIVLFPVYLIRRFIGFIYFFFSSLTLNGLKNWWDNLCQDQPGGCGDLETKYKNIEAQLRAIRELVELMNSTATQ